MVDISPHQEIVELRSQLEAEQTAHERTKTELALTEVAYRQFVPMQFMTLMGANSILHARLGQHTEQVLTVLFSDIRDFTTLSESMTPDDNFRFLNSYMSVMEPVIAHFGGFIDKFMGDGFMALFSGSSNDALRAATGMLMRLEIYNQGRHRANYFPLRIGMGINTGITMLGTVGGENRMDSTAIGDTVNLASRLEASTKVYGVPLLISEHTFYGLENASNYSIRLIDRIRVKGKAYPQSVHEVFDADPAELRAAKKSVLPIFGEAVACYHLRDVTRAQLLFQQCHAAAPQDSVVELYLKRCKQYFLNGMHEGTGELDLMPAWSEEFSIGIPEIDAQHKAMLAKMHQLSDSFKHGKQLDVQESLDFLAQYVVQNFQLEERLMQESKYPFSAQHMHEHTTFVKYLAKLREEIETAEPHSSYVIFRIQILLVDWLINHTTKTDRHLGHFLRNPNLSTLEPGF
jgi:hemerythrin-like metal-binding protein